MKNSLQWWLQNKRDQGRIIHHYILKKFHFSLLFFCLSSLLCACMLFSFVHFILLSFHFSFLRLFFLFILKTIYYFNTNTYTHTYTYTSILNFWSKTFLSSVFCFVGVNVFFFFIYIGNWFLRSFLSFFFCIIYIYTFRFSVEDLSLKRIYINLHVFI